MGILLIRWSATYLLSLIALVNGFLSIVAALLWAGELTRSPGPRIPQAFSDSVVAVFGGFFSPAICVLCAGVLFWMWGS